MPFEFRMAWREMRPAIKKLVFMVSAIALGVGALAGIKGFSKAINNAMLRSSRDLIAADLTVRTSSPLSAGELSAMAALDRRGARMTRFTETLSMASPADSPQPLLCSIKAVDPNLYPFYGTVQLNPPLSLREALTDESAVVSLDFLVRTASHQGGEIQVGSRRFKIAAIILEEPDRLASGIEIGPRILLTQGGLKQSGLIQFGSRTTESFLFRLPPQGLTLEEATSTLRQGLNRRARISDYRNPNPSVTRGLERMANYLSLVGLLALLVGGWESPPRFTPICNKNWTPLPSLNVWEAEPLKLFGSICCKGCFWARSEA